MLSSSSGSAAPLRGSEAEFLLAVNNWKTCAQMVDVAAGPTAPAQKQRRGQRASASSRLAAAAAAAAASASAAPATAAAPPTTASRFFLYIEQSPPASPSLSSPSSSSSAAAAVAAASSSSPSGIRSLRLFASNLVNSWVHTLDFSSLRRHRESLGLGSVGWYEMLAMLQQAFQHPERIQVRRGKVEEEEEETSHEDDTLQLLVRYNIDSQVELEGSFTLQRVDEAEESEGVAAAAATSTSIAASIPPSAPTSAFQRLTPPQQALSHLLLGVFQHTQSAVSAAVAPLQSQLATYRSEASALRSETAALKAQLAQLESERNLWRNSSGSSGSGPSSSYGSQPLGGSFSHDDGGLHSSPSRQRKARPPPRPSNMSVLNPNSKRRKTGGIKIE